MTDGRRSSERTGSVLAGAGLTWRRQRLVWWIFLVTLVLGGFAGRQVSNSVAPFLDHSLAADRLVHGFDIGTVAMLATQPEAPLSGHSGGAVATVFFFFMLFITGGVLEVYRRDDKVPTAAFFEACGAFFWRFFRLCLVFLIVLIPVGGLAALLWNQAGKVMDRSVQDVPALWFYGVTIALTLFLLMTVRLWFDLAQVIVVAHNERKVRRALKTAAGLLRRNFLRLFGLYFSIGFVGLGVFTLGLWAWERLFPPQAITASLVWTQLLILWWIATRLWQRASETLWYRGHQPEPAPAYAPPPTPVFVAASSAPAV
jgi:hypothetical protein